MTRSIDPVVRELEGLRALARSLVHGDADADDLVQDTAVAALEHPPALDRPVRPWLGAVLRNRWRMDHRAASRRRAREAAIVPDAGADHVDAIDRARTLERLSAALIALAEPFRTTVIRRYLDGESSADIARSLAIPVGTVRWRLKTGLDRLRAALDETAQRASWMQALVPFAIPRTGVVLVKLKTKLSIVVALLLLVGGALSVWFYGRGRGDPVATVPIGSGSGSAAIPFAPPRDPTAPVSHALPTPGQGKATVELVTSPGGSITGRVVNWSTGDGVGGAELTFSGDAGAETVRSRDDGNFELAPPAPGGFTLTTVVAPGFLPYAPEYLHSTVHVTLTKDRAVRGVTVFLFPALDYRGKVVDAAGAPIAGAKIKLLGTPAGEQVIDKLATEWTSAADGTFTFHAADEGVLEATRGTARGWARVDGQVMITHQLVIRIGDVAPRDATITGRVVDHAGHGVADALVAADPMGPGDARATVFAVSNPDGAFVLEHLDRDHYDLTAEAEDRAPARLRDVAGGTRDVTLVCDGGIVIAGKTVATDGTAIAAYTLTVFRREGPRRDLEVARSIVDVGGRFEVRIAPGDYELIAAAPGWAPSAPSRVNATKPVTDLELKVSVGATLRGTIVAEDDKSGLGLARVMREARGGGASTQPANAGTVTRSDGSFELTGIPDGPLSISIAAGGFNPKIEGGMVAHDGATLGPMTIALTRLAEGETPKTELVGIGIAFGAEGEGLLVNKVIPGGGAEAAGIVAGDHVIAVDGISASELGLDGAVAKIRGVVGTTVSITLQRGAKQLVLVCERRKIRA